MEAVALGDWLWVIRCARWETIARSSGARSTMERHSHSNSFFSCRPYLRGVQAPLRQCFLKNCTSRSCCRAFSSVVNVPRLRRLPVDSLFLREYKRYSPDLSLRIICIWMRKTGARRPRRTRDQNRVRILNERCRRTSNLTRVTPRVTSRLKEGNFYVSNHLQFRFSTKG